jgi:hypothetical protein
MSSIYTAEQLYQLLPALYRIRDAGQGEPLKAFLKVIAGQIGIIEEDIAQLYRDWFIETSDEWVIPYIGDLLGVKGVYPVSDATYSPRAFVANTIAYRRRKGTAAMLEQLARDITGWPARVVEFFQLLGTTQNVNHLRPQNLRTPDLRRVNTLDLLDTPFDTIAHTADVRRIASGRGKHNIPNIGIFSWRLKAYPIYRATAFSHREGRFSFSPLGNDIPLFNNPETETTITHLAEEINVPGPIRRLAFLNNKEAYYGTDRSILIWVNNTIIPAANIIPCNLENWAHRPPAVPPGMVAVDPVLGRFAFPPGVRPSPSRVEVRYFYGFSSEVGGGCYNRNSPLLSIAPGEEKYLIGRGTGQANTLAAALTSWAGSGKPGVVLQITDSRIYNEDIEIDIPAHTTLEIRAVDGEFPLIRLENPLTIKGGTGARLILNGLRLWRKPLIIGPGDLEVLEIKHCTIQGVQLDESSPPGAANISLKVIMERTISGAVKLLDIHNLVIKESIIWGKGPELIQGPNLVIDGSTVMGSVSVRVIELASNSIFTGKVTAQLTQKGCVRFSYIPFGSQVPRRYRCQPDLAIKKAIEEEEKQKNQFPLPLVEQEIIAARIRSWLKPVFTSGEYGHPGFAQLSLNCPKEITEGADNGAEMGVFQHLLQPQRVANLRTNLEEYLPANMEAGIFLVN